MSDRLASTSSNSRSLFESALQAYKTHTGVTLAEHLPVLELQNCHSTESITAFLKDQLRLSSSFGGSDRILRSIENIVSILSTLSATAVPDWAVGLVRPKMLMIYGSSQTAFSQILSPENSIHAWLLVLLSVRVFIFDWLLVRGY
jgi:hypothetical protein